MTPTHETRSGAAPAIECARLTKRFDDHTVLTDIGLSIDRGEVVCIIGPSGSGKSTLLRCFNGLVLPDSGELSVLGTDLMDPGADLVSLRRRVGMVFQQFNLFPHRRVLENVAEGPRYVMRVSKEQSREIALSQLERVGLSDKLTAHPSQLSGGQQQRVAIARALALNPEIMLFDECTSALDPELVGEVLAVIKQLADEQMTIIMVSHEMAFARSVADRVVMIDDARIVEHGPAGPFFAAPREDRTKRFLSRLSWQDETTTTGPGDPSDG